MAVPTPKALPNPQRVEDPRFGLLAKVFLLSPRKPTSYEYPVPPKPVEQMTRPELQAYHTELAQNTLREEVAVRTHQTLIKRFANFLQKNSIAVAYDQLLTDTSANNKMRWCQEQIEDSDYVILVITQSFREFLEKETPKKEFMFGGNYLYNLIYDSDVRFLPVFLNQPVDLELLPVPLKASRVYRVKEPFKVEKEDLTSLYAILTNQKLCEAPKPEGVVALKPKRRGFGGGGESHMAGLYAQLSSNHLRLNRSYFVRLAQNDLFSSNWRQLAHALGLSEVQIEQCHVSGRDEDADICYYVFQTWRDNLAVSTIPTVSALAEVLHQMGKTSMLEVLDSVVCRST